MSYGTSHHEIKVQGVTVVNYTFRAVFAIFFISLLTAGFCVALAASLTDLSGAAWLALTPTAFAILIKVCDRTVYREIEEGRHDPVWRNNLRRQSQRKANALLECNPMTRWFFRLACLLGIY